MTLYSSYTHIFNGVSITSQAVNKVVALAGAISDGIVGFHNGPILGILLQYLQECGLLQPRDLGWADCGIVVLTNTSLLEGGCMLEISKGRL